MPRPPQKHRCPGSGKCRQKCHGPVCNAALLVFKPPEEFSLNSDLQLRLDAQITAISRQLEDLGAELGPQLSLALYIEPVAVKPQQVDDPDEVVVPVIRPVQVISSDADSSGDDGSPGDDVTAEARHLLGRD